MGLFYSNIVLIIVFLNFNIISCFRLFIILLIQVLVVAASLVESVLTLYKDIIGRLPENDNRSATLQAGHYS